MSTILPSINEILVRLSHHWCIENRRSNRRKKRREMKLREIKNWNNRLDNLVWVKQKCDADWSACNAKIRARIEAAIEEADTEAERDELALDSHPFCGLIRTVSKYTGEHMETLKSASFSEFNGFVEVASFLSRFQQTDYCKSLIGELYQRYPDIMEKSGIQDPVVAVEQVGVKSSGSGAEPVKVNSESEVSAEFRHRGSPDGALLTVAFIRDPTNYGLSGPYLSKNYIGRKLRLGRRIIYHHQEVAALSDKIKRPDDM